MLAVVPLALMGAAKHFSASEKSLYSMNENGEVFEMTSNE